MGTDLLARRRGAAVTVIITAGIAPSIFPLAVVGAGFGNLEEA